MDKTIPIGLMRGLLVKQKGRCAISGLPLTTNNVVGDHIYPLKLQKVEGNPKYDNKKNIWLVHQSFNDIKSTFTYDDLIENCKKILAYEKEARKLKLEIRAGKVDKIEASDFDDLVNSVYNKESDTLEFPK